MPIINRIAEFHADMADWRHHIHAHPETAFEEVATSDYVAKMLGRFGIQIHRGLAGTGIVGTLAGTQGDGPAIGLRADLDALHIHEKNEFDHRSLVPGKMHACGHDGHTTMLLGAARYLAETRNFAGTVHFIFQPAEETEGGGRVMVEEGLFDLFPMEAVFGMHNFPGMEVGKFAMLAGPAMAAADTFDITVRGRGSHAAAPHMGNDAIVAAASIVTALQTVASRTMDPVKSVVVSVTQFHAGEAYNILPEDVLLRGTARSFDTAVQDSVEPTMRRIIEGIAAAMGVEAEFEYRPGYPPLVNNADESIFAAGIAAEIVSRENVDTSPDPKMGAEDFSYMLNERPGAYIWVGNGPGESGCYLHNPNYDFNDQVLPLGASYWARLAETRLAPK